MEIISYVAVWCFSIIYIYVHLVLKYTDLVAEI